MSEFDPSVIKDVWQDPATALQIAGMLAPNVTRTRNTLYGPQRTTLDIRGALSGFGQMYGGMQQKKIQEDLFDQMARLAASEQRSPGPQPLDTSRWAMQGYGGESEILPGPEPERSLLYQAQKLSAPPTSISQFAQMLTPKQKQGFLQGAGRVDDQGRAVGLSPSMAMFTKLQQETQGIRQQQRSQIGLQAMERVSANPGDTEAMKILGLVSNDPQMMQTMLADNRFRVNAAKIASDKGLTLTGNSAADAQMITAALASDRDMQMTIKRNHDALDRLEVDWKKQGLDTGTVFSGLRVLASTGQPINPAMLGSTQGVMALGVFANEFPTYADSKAAWQPLDELTLKKMMGSTYWPMVQGEVTAFQKDATEFKQRLAEFNWQKSNAQANRESAMRDQDWRQVAVLSDDLGRLDKVRMAVRDPANIPINAWKVPPSATSLGEVSDDYKKNVLLPAEQQYYQALDAYEASRDAFFGKYSPRTEFNIDMAGARRSVERIVTSAESPEMKKKRLDILEDIQKKKNYSYEFGEQVRKQSLDLIADARKRIDSVAPPGVAPKAAGVPVSGRSAAEEAEEFHRRSKTRFGAPLDPRTGSRVLSAPFAPAMSQEEQRTMLANITGGRSLKDLSPEERRVALEKLRREVERRKESVDATIASRSLTPPEMVPVP